jgi:hypothetical protein
LVRGRERDLLFVITKSVNEKKKKKKKKKRPRKKKPPEKNKTTPLFTPEEQVSKSRIVRRWIQTFEQRSVRRLWSSGLRSPTILATLKIVPIQIDAV